MLLLVTLCLLEVLSIAWMVQARRMHERDGVYMAQMATEFVPMLAFLPQNSPFQNVLPSGAQWAVVGVCLVLMLVSTTFFIVRHPRA
jgi:hypothetical protein